MPSPIPTSFDLEDVRKKVKPKHLGKFDPLYVPYVFMSSSGRSRGKHREGFIVKDNPRKTQFGGSIWVIGLVVLAVYGGFMVVGGAILSDNDPRRGKEFLSFLDVREFFVAFLLYCVFSPAVYMYFAWQPRHLNRVFDQLWENGVIIRSKSTTDLHTSRIRPSDYYIGFAIFLSALLIGIGAWWNETNCPANPACFGYNMRWFHVQPWYRDLRNGLLFIDIFLLVVILLRQIYIGSKFSYLFSEFEVKPKLFHPDRCNGLAPIGSFAIVNSSIALFVGLWLSFLTVYPAIGGREIRFDLFTGSFFVAYIVAIPLLLLPPILPAHIYMEKSRNDTLEPLGKKIREKIQELDAKDEMLEVWERRYEILNKEHRTWPFRRLAISSFLITAGLPIIVQLLSYK